MQTPIFYNKTKRRGLFRAILGGIFTVSGILLLILPLAVSSGIEDITKSLIYLTVGGVSLVAGFCVMISGLTQWLVRPYAVVFTKDGLYDFTGKHKNGLFVEWHNVKDSKVCGKGDSAFIGIDLISLDIAYKSVTGKQKREICENISNNMPAIMIHQNEVTEPIGSIVKTILQIRLGTKADLFNTEELKPEPDEPSATPTEENDTELTADEEKPYALEFFDSSPEEKSESKKDLFIQNAFEKTGPIDIPETADALIEEPIDSEENAQQEPLLVIPEPVTKVENDKKAQEKEMTQKDFSKAASIDDLLAMLSIGDEK